METHGRDEPLPAYDRTYLLSEDKRNDVLTLDEVRRYGRDSFGDPEYVAVYGMKPGDWYARGVRLLARTAVECTRDDLADLIGREVAAVAGSVTGASDWVVVDPFAGSGNTLYWLQRHLGATRAVGFEVDDAVFRSSRKNLSIIESSIQMRHGNFVDLLPTIDIGSSSPLILFLAPPWGDALREEVGLDLRRTAPPVAEIVDRISGVFGGAPMLFAIQIYERLALGSLEELATRFEWTRRHMYDLNAPGRNHGVLIGTLGWKP